MTRATYHLTQAECDRLKLLCKFHTQEEAAAIVGTCSNAVTRAKQRGWKAYQPHWRRPLPSDFALHADRMTKRQLRDHYGTSQRAVERWPREFGRKNMPRAHGAPPLPMPADFAEVTARLITLDAVAEHYAVSRSTVKKWRLKAGLTKRRNLPSPLSMIGWAERYVAERRAESSSQRENIHV